MKKLSPNSPCPCGSQTKYKKCCQRYHKGALPKSARELMASRYVAYAIGDSHYIIQTTHPDHPEYKLDTNSWLEEIDSFSHSTEFLGLDIIEFVDGETEAFVTFEAHLSSGTMIEQSRFVQIDGRWLYESGVVSHATVRE